MELTFGVALAVAVAVFGGGGGLWVLLRYNREEAAAIVAQQGAVLQDMQTMYAAAKAEHAAMRTERDEVKKLYEATKAERDRCHLECIRLRSEVRQHHEQVAGCLREMEALKQELGRLRGDHG